MWYLGPAEGGPFSGCAGSVSFQKSAKEKSFQHPVSHREGPFNFACKSSWQDWYILICYLNNRQLSLYSMEDDPSYELELCPTSSHLSFFPHIFTSDRIDFTWPVLFSSKNGYFDWKAVNLPFLSPPVQLAWWTHMHIFLSVCLTRPQGCCWLLGAFQYTLRKNQVSKLLLLLLWHVGLIANVKLHFLFSFPQHQLAKKFSFCVPPPKKKTWKKNPRWNPVVCRI